MHLRFRVSPSRRLKEEEEELRRRFADQVKAEESRFRSWEQRLIAERDRLNKELEREHDNLKRLQETVADLIRASAPSPVAQPK